MITDEFINVVRDQFELDWDGIHGKSHWDRVLENGLRLTAFEFETE